MPPADTELGNWDKYEKCCADFWVKMNNDEDKQSNCGDCCVTHGLVGLASLKSAPFTATSFTWPQEQQLDSQMTKSYVLSMTFKKCDFWSLQVCQTQNNTVIQLHINFGISRLANAIISQRLTDTSLDVITTRKSNQCQPNTWSTLLSHECAVLFCPGCEHTLKISQHLANRFRSTELMLARCCY